LVGCRIEWWWGSTKVHWTAEGERERREQESRRIEEEEGRKMPVNNHVKISLY
jgi:hypothetical protein